MKHAGLLLLLLFVNGQTSDQSQARQPDAGSGSQLVQRCRLYFEFLGRTGAGREDTFERGCCHRSKSRQTEKGRQHDLGEREPARP